MNFVTLKRQIYPYQRNLSNHQLTLQLFYSLIIRKVKIGVGRNTNGQNLQVQIAQVLQFSSSSDSKSNDWTMKSQLQSIMYQTWSPKRALKGTRPVSRYYRANTTNTNLRLCYTLQSRDIKRQLQSNKKHLLQQGEQS